MQVGKSTWAHPPWHRAHRGGMFSAWVRRWELTSLNESLCSHGELPVCREESHHQQNTMSDFCSLSCVIERTYACMIAPFPSPHTLGRETSPPGWRGSWITGFHSSLMGTQGTEESRAWPASHCWKCEAQATGDHTHASCISNLSTVVPSIGRLPPQLFTT